MSTYTQLREGWQLREDATVSYRLTDRDNVSAQARWSALRGTPEPFSETLISLRWSHRW
jgi:hypothetical protein